MAAASVETKELTTNGCKMANLVEKLTRNTTWIDTNTNIDQGCKNQDDPNGCPVGGNTLYTMVTTVKFFISCKAWCGTKYDHRGQGIL
jgi:hypothetical protein